MAEQQGVDPVPAPGRPYLDRLNGLVHAYPPLVSFLAKISNEDAGRQLVRENFAKTPQKQPGRCYCLTFQETEVRVLSDHPDGFQSPKSLHDYLTASPAVESRADGNRRLFILEDLDPDYVNVLGENLGIDPLVFSEQMNTWNYSNSYSIPYRGLPSVLSPKQSFTLRYYEFRTMNDPASVDRFTFQMTFAVNRRRYERWRDVDLPLDHSGERHSFVRRCASFWTSQETGEEKGWDAVIMVDPGMLTPVPDPAGTSCLILRDPRTHKDRASLWNAEVWDNKDKVKVDVNASRPYHDGCPALAPLLYPHSSEKAKARIAAFHEKTHRISPLDEQVFYWTKIATEDIISAANVHSSNTTYYLLKHIAQHWTSQLELINCTVAMAEYFSDDYQAKTDSTLNGSKWRADLTKVNECTMDINYMRRQMNHFWRAMVLNLERLGVQLGNEQVDKDLPRALWEAQKDLITIHARMEPLRQRVASLAAMATDLASLRAAFKGTHDSDFSLRLGLFASAVFPLTLIASIFSMGDNFLPGKSNFWIFWASSVPLVILSAVLLRYGLGWRYVVQAVRFLLSFLRGNKMVTLAKALERWDVRGREWMGRMGTKIKESSSSLC